jgi:vancomycin resistance protein VanJ
MHQARSLAFALAGNPRPLILAGDLNAPESSPVLGTLKAIGLRDAFSAAGIGYGYTHGHSLRPGFSFLRIDHVLVSAGIGVADCFVGGSEASEHRPVIADLLLSRMR